MLKLMVKQYQEEMRQAEIETIDFEPAVKIAKFKNNAKLETLKFFIV